MMLFQHKIMIASLGSITFHLLIAWVLFTTQKVTAQSMMAQTEISIMQLETFQPEPKKIPPPYVPPIVQPQNETAPAKIKESLKANPKIIKAPKIEKEPLPPSAANEKDTIQTKMENPAPQKQEQQEVAQTTPKQLHVEAQNAISLYLAKVRQKIQSELRYPLQAKKMGMEGETVVRFLIHSNGMVEESSIKVAKSSGKTLLDRHAIAAVLDALPFEIPPQNELEIVMPIVFKIQS